MKKFQEIYEIDCALKQHYINFYQLNIRYCLLAIPEKYYSRKKEEYEIKINKCLLEEQIAWQNARNRGIDIAQEMKSLEKILNLNIANPIFNPDINPFYRIYYNLYYQSFIQKGEKRTSGTLLLASDRYDFYEQLFFYAFIRRMIEICDKNPYFRFQIELAMQLYRNIFYIFSCFDTLESILLEKNFEKQKLKRIRFSWQEYKKYKNLEAVENLEDFLKDLHTLSIEDLNLFLNDFSTLIYLNTNLSLIRDASKIEEAIDKYFIDEEKKKLLMEAIKQFFPETMRFRLIK